MQNPLAHYTGLLRQQFEPFASLPVEKWAGEADAAAAEQAERRAKYTGLAALGCYDKHPYHGCYQGLYFDDAGKLYGYTVLHWTKEK